MKDYYYCVDVSERKSCYKDFVRLAPRKHLYRELDSPGLSLQRNGKIALQNNSMKRQRDRRDGEGERIGSKGENEKLKIFLEKLVGARLLKVFSCTYMCCPRL